MKSILVASGVGFLVTLIGSVGSLGLLMTRDRGVSSVIGNAVTPKEPRVVLAFANKKDIPEETNTKSDRNTNTPTTKKDEKSSSKPKKDDGPVVELPDTITAKPNRYFHIRATTNCASIKWIIPDGLEQLDPSIPLKDSFLIVLIGDTGTYKVQCYGALDNQASDIASCTVTIGSPTPPGPTPPGPTPPSSLTAAFQTAYNKDTDADKATSLQFLQGVYEGLGQLAPTWTDVKTNGDAQARISAVVQAPNSGLNANQVVNLRTAIATEFVSKFGSDMATPIVLTTLAAEFNTIATALKGVK